MQTEKGLLARADPGILARAGQGLGAVLDHQGSGGLFVQADQVIHMRMEQGFIVVTMAIVQRRARGGTTWIRKRWKEIAPRERFGKKSEGFNYH